MHHYPHHIGDYAKDTPGLTMMEHGAYRLLMDAYYATELPIPADEPYAIAKAGSAAERQAVDKVLRKFFVMEDGAYRQKRIDQEIDSYRAKAAISRENGKLGGRPKQNPGHNPAGNPRETQQVTRQVTQQEPGAIPEITLTNNQEPRTKKNLSRASRLPTDWELPEDWKRWALEARPEWGDAEVLSVADGFRDYWLAAPRGTKLDWEATWRNWVRNTKAPPRAGGKPSLPSYT